MRGVETGRSLGAALFRSEQSLLLETIGFVGNDAYRNAF
jgi:hypothetical protein